MVEGSVPNKTSMPSPSRAWGTLQNRKQEEVSKLLTSGQDNPLQSWPIHNADACTGSSAQEGDQQQPGTDTLEARGAPPLTAELFALDRVREMGTPCL